MTSPALLEHLNAAWSAAWPATPPLGFLLRDHHSDRWVRFHSLPESKRYAETEAEYATVTRRHHAVLDELGASGECVVIAAAFASDRAGASPEPPSALQPGAEQWRTVEAYDFLAEPAVLYASLMDYPSPALDQVLRAASDDDLAATIIGPNDLGWLYHPYDGGADVIARSSAERDHLKTKFNAWLSDHPAGL
jgi:hypothetical protein